MEPANMGQMYKPLVLTRGGRLVSLVADEQIEFGNELEYTEGEITYSPEDGYGIWVCETLDQARHVGRISAKAGILVIHEVTPLGNARSDVCPGYKGIRYPAVVVGREVWSEDSTVYFHVPKEVWKDVTGKCTVKIKSTGGYHWVSVIHGGEERLVLGKEPTLWAVQGGVNADASDANKYKVEWAKNGADYFGFRILMRRS